MLENPKEKVEIELDTRVIAFYRWLAGHYEVSLEKELESTILSLIQPTTECIEMDKDMLEATNGREGYHFARQEFGLDKKEIEAWN